MNKSDSINPNYCHPNLLRRLMAIAYDLILLISVLFICLLILLPFLPEGFRESHIGKLAIQCYLLLIIFLFFAWFWTHGGQTLGMRAWRLKVVTGSGNDISWGLAFKRFIYASISLLLFGFGFLWCLIDSDNMTWHDKHCGSKLVMLKKRSKRNQRTTQDLPDNNR